MEKEKKRKSEREKERKKIEKEKGKKNGEKRNGKRGRESECAPAIIAVGGRTWATGRRAARDETVARKKRERERERGTVGEKEKVESTNGIECWESGVRDREKIPGIMVRGFRRILSSTMTRILKIYF